MKIYPKSWADPAILDEMIEAEEIWFFFNDTHGTMIYDASLTDC